MSKATVVCDRCGRTVEGLRLINATSGFYDMTDEYWKRYAREGERVVCDDCMFKDPNYIADYGQRSSA